MLYINPSGPLGKTFGRIHGVCGTQTKRCRQASLVNLTTNKVISQVYKRRKKVQNKRSLLSAEHKSSVFCVLSEQGVPII